VRLLSEHEIQRMSENVGHSAERLRRALWRARHVENETLANDPGHPTGESTERADGSHRLGQARGFTFDDSSSGLRCQICRGKPGSSSSHHESSKAGRHLAQRFGYSGNAVGCYPSFYDGKPLAGQEIHQNLARAVSARALIYRIRNREHFGLERHAWRRYRAPLQENGRIAIMFCAFAGSPRIVRLHGTGRIVLPEDAGFAELADRLPRAAGVGVRSVIVLDVSRVADSCGFGVPLMTFEGHRPTMDQWST
jgi:hypothetical protein